MMAMIASTIKLIAQSVVRSLGDRIEKSAISPNATRNTLIHAIDAWALSAFT
jgi:hypothetical protein